MFSITVGRYRIRCTYDGLPELYAAYRAHAALVEEFGLEEAGSKCCVGVEREAGRPILVVAQTFSPSGGFFPGVLLLPETGTLFLGAGERLLAYRLDPPDRLWEDTAELGFWSWSSHGQVVLMAAELELAAWSADGRKLWTTFVEPPWSYTVREESVHLDVMGSKVEFPLAAGPKTAPPSAA